MLNKTRIGEIVSVHGVKGALKVLPLTDNPIRFCSLTEVELVPKRKDSRGAGKYKVMSATPSGNIVLLKLYGIEGVARLCVHCWNTEEEIGAAVDLLRKLAK